MTNTAAAAPLTTGDIVRYRKVGTFRILGISAGQKPDSRGACYFDCEPVKAPKKYRDDHAEHGTALYVGPADRTA